MSLFCPRWNNHWKSYLSIFAGKEFSGNFGAKKCSYQNSLKLLSFLFSILMIFGIRGVLRSDDSGRSILSLTALGLSCDCRSGRWRASGSTAALPRYRLSSVTRRHAELSSCTRRRRCRVALPGPRRVRLTADSEHRGIVVFSTKKIIAKRKTLFVDLSRRRKISKVNAESKIRLARIVSLDEVPPPHPGSAHKCRMTMNTRNSVPYIVISFSLSVSYAFYRYTNKTTHYRYGCRLIV